MLGGFARPSRPGSNGFDNRFNGPPSKNPADVSSDNNGNGKEEAKSQEDSVPAPAFFFPVLTRPVFNDAFAEINNLFADD